MRKEGGGGREEARSLMEAFTSSRGGSSFAQSIV